MALLDIIDFQLCSKSELADSIHGCELGSSMAQDVTRSCSSDCMAWHKWVCGRGLLRAGRIGLCEWSIDACRSGGWSMQLEDL